MLSFETMPLSRRQFFQKLTNPAERTKDERRRRYELMDEYVRMNLLPYDIAYSEEQEHELRAAVRADLEQATDEELFSAIIRFRVEEVADRVVRVWREQSEKERLGTGN